MFWIFIIVSLGIWLYDVLSDPEIREKLKKVEE
jgi:hypothetical protein